MTAARACWSRARVVVVSHTATLSGGELALARLLAAVVGEVDVHVLLAEDGPLVGELEQAGATVEVLPMAGPLRDLRRGSVQAKRLPWRTAAEAGRYTVELARRLRHLSPDVVHTNTLKAAFYGGIAARLAGRPCLWHIRDRIEDDYLPAQAVRLTRVLARILPQAVVTDTFHVLDTLHLPPGLGHVIPSPIPAAPPPRHRDPPDAPFAVTMVGRLAPWKGQEIFIRAFLEAFPHGEELAVLVGSAMFGEQEYEAQLHAVVEDLGGERRVRFLGFRRDVQEELARADVLVHASLLPEPFGQVVLEAMAAGVPVVASRAGGPAEVVTDRRDGLLVPPGDVAALAEALRSLRSDAGLRRRLAEQGRVTAGRFRPEVVGPRFVRLYRAMASSRSPGYRLRPRRQRLTHLAPPPSHWSCPKVGKTARHGPD